MFGIPGLGKRATSETGCVQKRIQMRDMSETERSYPVGRQPLEIEYHTDRDVLKPELELERIWEDTLQQLWPGLTGTWRIDGGRIVLPRLHELRFDGRGLRGGEEDWRAVSILQLFAQNTQARVIHWWVEERFLLDWDAFGNKEFEELQCIYSNLPGWIQDPKDNEGGDQWPQWFGATDGPAPWLTASVEPPGLDVYGTLPLPVWSDWQHRFLDAMATLPIRTF